MVFNQSICIIVLVVLEGVKLKATVCVVLPPATVVVLPVPTLVVPMGLVGDAQL